MEILEIQKELFRLIKSKLPADVSMPEEIAKLLQISSDSAYRRMRGEKLMTFEEVYLLCAQFRISLDQLLNIQTGSFLFQGNLVNPDTYRYNDYLNGMMHTMAYFNSFKEKMFIYLCKDTPIFHYFNHKDLAYFKYYFWMSTLLFFPEFRDKKVDLDDYPAEISELGEKVLNLYNQMDTVEIWNIESWNTTLHQIEYCRDSQMFQSDSDALRVYEAIEKVLDHLEDQAQQGFKFSIHDPEKKMKGKFSMYFNEILIQDNSMIVLLDNTKIALISYASINYMMTRNVDYSEYFYQYVRNLMKRSTLISEVSEKERSRYFRRMRERIERRKELLSV